ncbi:hypothetical protein R6Q59_037007, partial [Mikania micrantha]
MSPSPSSRSPLAVAVTLSLSDSRRQSSYMSIARANNEAFQVRSFIKTQHFWPPLISDFVFGPADQASLIQSATYSSSKCQDAISLLRNSSDLNFLVQ